MGARRGPTHTRMLRLTGPALLAAAGCTVVGYPSVRGGPAPPPVVSTAPGDQPERPDRIVTRDLPVDASLPPAEPRSERGNPPSYEIEGRTYYVMSTGDGYDETGVASWYGDEFAGRPTSSGEIFDPDLLTAAHRTLPLPTWVEVTNLDNGRSVVVRVNDRGPFARTEERIIDLSEAAARRLGMIGAGTARVRVRSIRSAGGRG